MYINWVVKSRYCVKKEGTRVQGISISLTWLLGQQVYMVEIIDIMDIGNIADVTDIANIMNIANIAKEVGRQNMVEIGRCVLGGTGVSCNSTPPLNLSFCDIGL